MIPFLDLGASYRELKPKIDSAVARVLDSGWYILGPEVEAFEAEWASYCEANHAVGLANGLDALILALRVLDVGPGDEVIVPSNTYIATWLAVSAVGATPVPVEPNPATHNIDPTRIAAAITPKTKVLLPVHLYGQPADMDPILMLARQHGLAVVEDAAQAHGARYKGRRIGGALVISSAGAFILVKILAPWGMVVPSQRTAPIWQTKLKCCATMAAG